VEKVLAYSQGKGYGAGTIKQEVSSVFKHLGTSPKLAIDIGGNVGKYSQELRRRQSDLEIHIFEPASVNIKKLHTKFAGDSLITINACGISNSAGDSTLFSNEAGSGLGSLSKRRLDHFGIDFNVREDIKLMRFEEYWKSTLNCRVIDIVKLDIEGHELEGLKSFGGALAATKVVQFEFGGCNIDTKSYFQDFYYFFKENNFGLSRITPFGLQHIDGYREIDEFFSTTNYLATNNKQLS
jgi:FkbM family methyltransferase